MIHAQQEVVIGALGAAEQCVILRHFLIPTIQVRVILVIVFRHMVEITTDIHIPHLC